MTLLHRFLPRTDFASYEDFTANYRVHVPETFNFAYDIVDAWAEAEPEKKALIWCDDHGGEETFTFRDISILSQKTANALMALGVGKGDRVMLIMRRRYEAWLFLTALCRIGAIAIPASNQLMTKDVVYRNEAAHVKMIVSVAGDSVLDKVDEAMAATPVESRVLVGDGERDGWISFAPLMEEASETFARPSGENAIRNEDIMLMFFTSGTTGMPKMVRHNFMYPLGHIVTAYYWHRVREDSVHFTMSDSGWAKFAWGKIYGQWICGAAIFAYDMDKFVPEKLLDVLQKHHITSFCAPPTVYRYLIKEDLARYDLSSIRRCSTAGEPLNPEVYNQIRDAIGLEIIEGFGQSESPVLIANFEWFAPRPGSTGKPSPAFDIAIVNDDGTPCEEGEEGEIVIRGLDECMPAGLFAGYESADGSVSEWDHGVYHTGDVAWYDDDGYYWFVGRKDDVIKCSGYRIGPFEVESALMEHPSVLECAVTAVPDPLKGEVVKATIVLAKGHVSSDALTKALQNHVKKTTAPYKYPRVIEYVEELPKTTSGKIRRNVIRARDLERLREQGQ